MFHSAVLVYEDHIFVLVETFAEGPCRKHNRGPSCPKRVFSFFLGERGKKHFFPNVIVLSTTKFALKYLLVCAQ